MRAREGTWDSGESGWKEKETEGSLFSTVHAERKTQRQETGWMNV